MGGGQNPAGPPKRRTETPTEFRSRTPTAMGAPSQEIQNTRQGNPVTASDLNSACGLEQERELERAFKRAREADTIFKLIRESKCEGIKLEALLQQKTDRIILPELTDTANKQVKFVEALVEISGTLQGDAVPQERQISIRYSARAVQIRKPYPAFSTSVAFSDLGSTSLFIHQYLQRLDQTSDRRPFEFLESLYSRTSVWMAADPQRSFACTQGATLSNGSAGWAGGCWSVLHII